MHEVKAAGRSGAAPGGKRVVIAGGGTGGHLFPGLAVADELRKRFGDVSVLFAGTARGIEARVLPKRGEELALRDRGHAAQGTLAPGASKEHGPAAGLAAPGRGAPAA
ncbi:MAG: glycosyltransferase, partial [Myxococcota bacterium]